MKQCPQCQSIYTDETLNFCLMDGTQLVSNREAEPTQKLPDNIVTEFSQPKTAVNFAPAPTVEKVHQPQIEVKKNTNWFWASAAVGFFAVLLGMVGIWFVIKPSENPNRGVQNSVNENVKTAPIAENNQNPTNKNSGNSTNLPPEKPANKPRETTYRVINVAGNDVLYVRPSAGKLDTFVGKIPPNATGIRIVGGGVKVGKSLWLPISYQNINGWVNSKFLAKQ